MGGRGWRLNSTALRIGRNTRGFSGGCSVPHFGHVAGTRFRL
jgi:hypothetical protein